MKIESNKVSITTESPQLSGIICYKHFFNNRIQLYYSDCKELIDKLEFDCIISDLPYNTNYAKWDKGLNPNFVFKFKAKGYVLFAVQPLTSQLIVSNLENYKYDLVWCKNTYKSNSFKTRPGRQHETILIFGDLPYNAQMIKRTETEMQRLNYEQRAKYEFKNPASVLFFDAINNRNGKRTGHPAEKPVKLMQYLIKTYTNENDIIFDPYMGTGTTAIACLYENRKFIGIEKELKYYEIAVNRVSNHCL